METHKVLLGHKDGDITTHYSVAELEELLYWMERLTERGAIQTPTLTVLERLNVGYSSDTIFALESVKDKTGSDSMT
ncbi:MAG: hypothetical protein K1563_13905 [Candidatus Thiodiazotropha sp. (ex. Lucinisca nassula)]|nr:hypothetical protein [Candidatus Thiodiazotropha sp. (ex. Lucinisca nassula)]